MINILELIQEKLKTIEAKVYRDQAPRGTKTPYVVWGIPNIADMTEKEEWDLEVTVFDYSDDADAAWSLSELIDTGLKETNIVEDGFLVRFLRQNRRQIPDPDPKLQRFELNYTTRIYNGN